MLLTKWVFVFTRLWHSCVFYPDYPRAGWELILSNNNITLLTVRQLHEHVWWTVNFLLESKCSPTPCTRKSVNWTDNFEYRTLRYWDTLMYDRGCLLNLCHGSNWKINSLLVLVGTCSCNDNDTDWYDDPGLCLLHQVSSFLINIARVLL